ncbi:MAG: hypothetical protein HOP04_03530 [Methylophilaceae bacterium]|nr:hypothetical protein [Methylophilaceae bacterium]
MKNAALIMLAMLCLTSCGEFTYKRGATAKDLESAKQNCQAVGNEAAVEKCLQDHGWLVQKLDTPDLFASVSSSSNMPNAETEKPLAATPTQTIPEKIPAANTAEKTKPGKQAETESSDTKTDSKPAPENLLQTYTINSWWKIGAGTEALNASLNTCVAQLGEAHKPNWQTQQFSKGLIICMREKGWRGLKATP